MKYITLLLFLTTYIFAGELKVKANSFDADEKAGISIFSGNVRVTKNSDELNASKVVIHVDKKNRPTQYIATGNVSFVIETEKKDKYRGVAQKVIFNPAKKEYHFFKSVHLKQLNDKKEIIGEEVFLSTVEGKAYAKGESSKPVIMIFDIPDDKEEK